MAVELKEVVENAATKKEVIERSREQKEQERKMSGGTKN
jgi:hypothetical protein